MPPVGGAYARYVLGLLVVIYAINFIDRQIISILAEDIKHDLRLTDAELGFLYGTAFAVFYALFGIPLGRLADNWVRVRLLSAVRERRKRLGGMATVEERLTDAVPCGWQ